MLVFFRDFNNIQVSEIIDLTLVFVLLLLVNLFVDFFVRRKFAVFALLGASIAMLLGAVLSMTFLAYLSGVIIAIIAIIAISVNIAETRTLLDNKFPSKGFKFNFKKNKNRSKAYYSHEDFYRVIEKATLYLSDNKIGALMTFEKKDNFDDICKNGTILNAPVTFELLITIFYPGTRLHDGAVVIRDNIILAASVFYKPSVERIGVKRGSRHRAALGISSETDAVTVVVSEETGRISIAVDGELTTYDQNEFLNAFVHIMEPENSGKSVEEE